MKSSELWESRGSDDQLISLRLPVDDTQASRSPMYIVVVVLALCVYDKVTISCFYFFYFVIFPPVFVQSLCEIKYYFITRAASLWYVVKLQQLWRTGIEKKKEMNDRRLLLSRANLDWSVIFIKCRNKTSNSSAGRKFYYFIVLKNKHEMIFS